MEIPDTDADVKSISDQRDGPNVLINNGILVIEELKPPDRPQDRELRDYVDKHTRSIQPATGDQVVYRLKEARAAKTGEGSPQVAVLGSSQVPVGLSSALGYLQLGQCARVKVPAELMEQAVDDTDAALHSLPTSPTKANTSATTTSKAQTPRTAAPAAAAQPTTAREGEGFMSLRAPAVDEPEGDSRQWQAPAAADMYTAAQEPAAAVSAPHHAQGVRGINELGGVVPSTLPPTVDGKQQTLREKYQPQQQQGLVAALAARYQQQSAVQPVMVTPQKGSAGAGGGFAVSSDVIKRADSDHSSWIPDSRASSRTSHEAPTAAIGHIRAVEPAGSRAVMSHRMPSASGWTSGASTPRSDGPADAFHTPGGTSYHSAVSTPVVLTQRHNSSALEDTTTSAGVQPGISSGSATEAAAPGVGERVATSHSKDPPHASALPQGTGGVVGFSSNSLLGSTGATVGQPLLVQSQKEQQGWRDSSLSEAAQSAAVREGPGGKPGSQVPTAYQTPDQVLQAAARKLEEQQHQQRPRLSFESALKPVEVPSNISSMVSAKRGAAGASRGVGEWQATPAGPGVLSGTQFVRVSSCSSDGAAGHQSGARSGAPSFKTWIPGRTCSTNDSTVMVAVAEEGLASNGATAAATGFEDPHQQSARPSVDRKMRYSGDYGSFRQSTDHEVQASAVDACGTDAGSSRAAAAAAPGDAAGVDAVAGGDGDQENKKEYELELLAIIPGRGKMSGKPVLSEAAQQQADLDIDELTRAVAEAEPHFKPPKPQKGLSGWVRRHLSVNLRSPASAGKRGMKWLGLRDCFRGSQQEQ